MQVSKEFLVEAVGLTLLVALLLMGVQVFQRSANLIAILEKEQEQKIIAMQDYEIVQYENRTIDGVTAVSYIKNMLFHYELKVLVETDKFTAVIDSLELCGELNNPESEYYVNPFGFYESVVVRDENSNVEYVYIKAKEGKNNE